MGRGGKPLLEGSSLAREGVGNQETGVRREIEKGKMRIEKCKMKEESCHEAANPFCILHLSISLFQFPPDPLLLH